MAAEIPGVAKTRALELVKQVREGSDEEFIRLSNAQVEALVDAIKEDLETLAHKGMGDEDRLAKVERQTRVLSEAVIAIAGTSETLARSVRAVKDGL